ncbi:MAG: hypothetical protein ACRC9K_07140 [Afipia sp.]
MKKVTFFAAAAAVTALIATPALAQDSMKPRAEKHMSAKHMKQHHASRHMRHHARAYRTDEMTSRDDWNNRNTGFWAGDVVGGAVGTAGAIAGTAVGTAGAVATAPFGGPYRESYAYGPMGYEVGYEYNGIAMPTSANYDARNGFSCRPGTFIKGTRTICQ